MTKRTRRPAELRAELVLITFTGKEVLSCDPVGSFQLLASGKGRARLSRTLLGTAVSNILKARDVQITS
jgi:hypothetical protein